MSRDELMRKIQELDFARVETELFLDTHPECRAALDFYRKVTGELEMLMTQYNNDHGPIVAKESVGDTWSWINGPWPWQMTENGNGNRKREG